MRHRVAKKKLSRHRDHRKALFKNLISSLVLHGEVKTTEGKAKAVRPLVEKLITRGKAGTLHARRLIAAFLQDKLAVNKIVDELGPLFKNRPGGYTRIIRLGKGGRGTGHKAHYQTEEQDHCCSQVSDRTSGLSFVNHGIFSYLVFTEIPSMDKERVIGWLDDIYLIPFLYIIEEFCINFYIQPANSNKWFLI